MAIDAQKLWADKYAAKFAAAKFHEDEARERAFVDDVYVVCGERIRGMTPRDMLHLQAVGSPFMYAGQEIQPPHITQFLWALHTANAGRFRGWKRQAMINRVLSRRSEDPINDAIAQISAYIADMFMDGPRGSGGESKPLGTCWLAPVMVRLASKIGTTDPLDGRAWADAPMGRIWQYLKAIRASEDEKYKDTSPSDRILSDWQAEVQGLTKEGDSDGV